MFLILGLGNPGDEYHWTRHNIGFLAMDKVAEKHQLFFKNQKQSLLTKAKIKSQDVFLAKPQKYMNLSGEVAQALMNYYKIPMENILVIQDDVDLDFGALKFQKNRGHGGHNGIRNIHQHLNSQDYSRLKVGVNSSFKRQDTADFVLGDFSKEEKTNLPELLDIIDEAVECFVQHGYEKSATKFNKQFLEK